MLLTNPFTMAFLRGEFDFCVYRTFPLKSATILLCTVVYNNSPNKNFKYLDLLFFGDGSRRFGAGLGEYLGDMFVEVLGHVWSYLGNYCGICLDTFQDICGKIITQNGEWNFADR